MALEKLKDFADYNRWSDEENPTTEAEWYEYEKNRAGVLYNLARMMIWQPGMAYNAGDVVRTPSMTGEKFAVCTTAGTTGTDEPAFATTAHGATITDGTVVWTVNTLTGFINDLAKTAIDANNKIHQNTDSSKITDWENAVEASVTKDPIKSALLSVILPDTAAAHNSIYRGKDLTSYWDSGEMSKAIASGEFTDIFPGDYIIKSVTINGTAYSNIKWIVGDLDYHYNRGGTNYNTHHVLLFPEVALGKVQMNSSDTTSGGYQGSDMWKTTIPQYATGIVNAFGSGHVLEHDELLTNNMNANAASSAASGWMGSAYWDWSGSPWQKVKVNIFNQAMVFGNHPMASSGQEEGDCNKQIAAFRYGSNLVRGTDLWLRDVAHASAFANVSGDGYARALGASWSFGVRPYFLGY